MDAVGRAQRRPAARRAHALLGCKPELGAQQRLADRLQHLQRAQAGARARSRGRVHCATGLRAVQHFRRRRHDHAGDARLGDVHAERQQQPGAQRRRAQPDRRAVRHARGRVRVRGRIRIPQGARRVHPGLDRTVGRDGGRAGFGDPGRGEGERSLSRAARAAAGGPAGRAAPRAVGSRALVGLRHLRSR